MIKLYWRPRQSSRVALIAIAALSLAGLAAVEVFQVETRQRLYDRKLAAAHLSAEALELIGRARAKLGHRPDPNNDPTGSGLVGELMSTVTSNSGSLRAKQTTVNPNFAAVLVDMLDRAGVREGDTIAIGFSGSFPALNVSVLAAARTAGLRPLIISSNAASQWGANDPSFLWVDWERTLAESKLLPYRSIASTIGGVEDRGIGMPAEGRRVIAAAIERSGVPFLEPRDYQDSIDTRMRLYLEAAGGAPIRAYVNVGGGTTSVGTRAGKHVFRPGLNLRPPASRAGLDSIMSRFAAQGVPVIHLVNIHQLARRHGIAVTPTERPPVGQGAVFSRLEYSRWIAAGFLLAILGSLYAFVRSDVGFRIMQMGRRKKGLPEPMV